MREGLVATIWNTQFQRQQINATFTGNGLPGIRCFCKLINYVNLEGSDFRITTYSRLGATGRSQTEIVGKILVVVMLGQGLFVHSSFLKNAYFEKNEFFGEVFVQKPSRV